MIDEAVLDDLTKRFYDRADRDPLLGPVIAAALPAERRAEHMAVFRDFWANVLLGSGRYAGSPSQAHAAMALEPRHFERWLEIFAEVAGETLPARQAEAALAQARHMSECLQGRPSGHCHDNRFAWPLGRAGKPPQG